MGRGSRYKRGEVDEIGKSKSLIEKKERPKKKRDRAGFEIKVDNPNPEPKSGPESHLLALNEG